MLLELKAIQKRFGGVVALRNGNLAVNPGEVHLLMGENGAGKSTLMKIVAGMQEFDGGEMLWRGQSVRFRSPARPPRTGSRMVHQESLLAPHLSVAENIFLGREERLPFGWVNRRKMMERAARLIEEHHFPLQAGVACLELSPAGKQLVEICRAIQHGSSLLIFDEPTSSLSESETKEVFRLVRALRDRNMAVIYITHRLEELRVVGDRVTVLRDGETVHTGALERPHHRSTDPVHGRTRSDRDLPAHHLPAGEEMLRVENLSRKHVLHDISFSLRAGEIVGMAGLIGAGRTELCRALFGADPIDSGSVWIAGPDRSASALRVKPCRPAWP